jgi:hypothetical protein
MIVYAPEQLEVLVETYTKWVTTEDGKNPKTSWYLTPACPPPLHEPALVLVPFYNGDEAEGRRIFKPFFDINPVADLTHAQPYVMQVITPIRILLIYNRMQC